MQKLEMTVLLEYKGVCSIRVFNHLSLLLLLLFENIGVNS